MFFEKSRKIDNFERTTHIKQKKITLHYTRMLATLKILFYLATMSNQQIYLPYFSEFRGQFETVSKLSCTPA